MTTTAHVDTAVIAVESKRPLAVGLLASRSMRTGPRSQLVRLVRDFEPYIRACGMRLYAVGGAARSIVQAGLLHQYDGLHLLPAGAEGGVVDVASRVVRARDGEPALDVVIYLMDPRDPSSGYPEVWALKRACVNARKPLLSNYATAYMWLAVREAIRGGGLYRLLSEDLVRELATALAHKGVRKNAVCLSERGIALVAHDAHKAAMVDFVANNIQCLQKFKRRYATGTTAAVASGMPAPRSVSNSPADQQRMDEAVGRLDSTLKEHGVDRSWIARMESGPNGGDIQIAHEVLCGRCDTVVFFEDVRTPQAHVPDIQLLERACRMPECDVVCLHDAVTAGHWFEHLRKWTQDHEHLPITMAKAFQLLFGVDLVAVPNSDFGHDAHHGTWNSTVRAAAYYVIEYVRLLLSRRSQPAQKVTIAASWGGGVQEIGERINGARRDLRQAAERLRARWDWTRPHDRVWEDGGVHDGLTIVPMVGTMGAIEPGREANDNARALAEAFGGTSLAVSAPMYMKTDSRERAFALSQWNEVDAAVFTCQKMLPHFNEWNSMMPPELMGQLCGPCVAEVAGMGLREDGSEPDIVRYARIGMSREQLRSTASRGGAILVAGGDPRRVDAVRCCIRAGIVSTLVTDEAFAHEIISREIGAITNAHAAPS